MSELQRNMTDYFVICVDEFAKLQNKDTGLYLESPAYIYDLYQNELRNGRLVQEEQ